MWIHGIDQQKAAWLESEISQPDLKRKCNYFTIWWLFMMWIVEKLTMFMEKVSINAFPNLQP